MRHHELPGLTSPAADGTDRFQRLAIENANTAVAAGRADLVLLDLPTADIERPLEPGNTLLQGENPLELQAFRGK